MTEITTRAGKGAPLTHDEVDTNFLNLQETADLAYAASAGLGGKANAAALGTDDAATDLGAFTSDLITDGTTAKGALQELATAIETTSGSAATKVNATAVGVAPTDADMGATPGTILSNNGTAKDWFEELEAEAEAASAEIAGKEPALPSGTSGQYLRGDKTLATLNKTAVGLANVDDTSDVNKPISTATQTALTTIEAALADVEAVVGIYFQSSWTGTEAELLALIASDPTTAATYDDSADFYAAWTSAIQLGFPLVINSVVYINSAGSVTVDGKRVELIGHATGTIVGGPDLDDRMIRAINSSTSGGTAARSVDAVVRNLRTNLEKSPQGTLNSVNHYNFSGFRRTIVDGCTLYSGAHYSTAGGDAGIFSTSNSVIVRDCNFYGMVDLGIYQSGSADGTLDNRNAVFIGNSYYNCANAWAAKRNYQYIRSVGEYFDGCYNGAAALAASGSGDGLLSGSRVSVVAPTFRNMENRCIDPRGSSNWHVTGMVVSGTFGKDYTAADVAGAAIVCISGSVRCRVDFVADVVSTGADHSAVRFQADGSTQATDNVVSCTVTGIANGMIETGSSNRNRVTIDCDSTVTTLYTIVGAASEMRWNKAGVRGYQIGSYDRLEGRSPFEGSLRAASTTLTLASVGRVERFEPAGSNINAVLPSGATNGDRITVYKTAAAGAGIVQIRNPANSSTLARILDANTQVTMVYNGQTDTWVPVSRTITDTSMPLLAVAPAAIPTPPSGAFAQFFDSNDNTMKVKNSSGAVSGRQFIRKTSDENVNNSSVLQDDDQLKYNIAASEVTNFRITITYQGSATADLKIAINAPTGATVRWSPVGGVYTSSALAPACTAEISGIGTTLVVGADGSNRHITIEGRVDNSTTAGEVALQWAQNVAEANNMTVRGGTSYVEVFRQ